MEFILGRLYILGGNTRETLLGRLQYAGSSDFIWRTFHGDFMRTLHGPAIAGSTVAWQYVRNSILISVLTLPLILAVIY